MQQPKYREIFEHLSHDIAGGQYEPGQKLPSEAALVRRFGASRITVGHAMRELQQQGLIDRIAGSGSFVRTGESRREGLLFGLMIPNLGETEIFDPICRAIAASPDAKGHALLWAEAGSEPEQFVLRGVSGVFFAPEEMTPGSAEANRRVMKRLREANIPIVLLDRRPDENMNRERCDLVGIDNHRAGFIAAEHLMKLGARRIGFVAYRNQASTVRARIAGYRDALGSAGEVLVPESGPESGCDAFVCANDRIAGELMHMLTGQGIRVPEDVRIVGIDDVNYAALLPVPLTTVHQPCRDIGETALRVMLERLDRPRMPARDVLLDCALVVRKSCGA
jgi:DNA-binding LacI/PurR family transcriptional regulator